MSDAELIDQPENKVSQQNLLSFFGFLALGASYSEPTPKHRRMIFVYALIAVLTLVSPLLIQLPQVSLSAYGVIRGETIFYGGAALLLLGLRLSKSETIVCTLYCLWFVASVCFHPVVEGNTQYLPLLTLILVPIMMGIASGSAAILLGAASVLIGYVCVGVAAHNLIDVADPSGNLMLIYAGVCTIVASLAQAYFSNSIRLQTDALSAAADNMRSQALTDALTSCGNRRAFQQATDRLLSQVGEKTLHAVLIIDLDRFKHINDTFGHEAGDDVLITYADRLRSILRENCEVFRLGGDEFAIIYENLPSDCSLKTLAESVVSASDVPVTSERGTLEFDVSVGMATSSGTRESVEKLYQRADTAAFAAKKKAGSNFVIFDSMLDGAITRRFEVEQCLKTAIRERSINIAVQPQVNLKTGNVVGFEALARWCDPMLGKISPNEFVPIAEQSSLITILDRQVFARSLRGASLWLPRHQKISINVSARSLCSKEFAPYVLRQIKRCRIRPDQVEIEITETALIENWESSKQTLDTLHKYGVRIALDDFGVGYSSLSYLDEFPIQKIKFDRSFLLRNESKPTSLIMESMVDLARKMDVEIVAEGVETKEQLKFLRQLGCSTGQGFLLGKPVLRENILKEARAKRNAA